MRQPSAPSIQTTFELHTSLYRPNRSLRPAAQPMQHARLHMHALTSRPLWQWQGQGSKDLICLEHWTAPTQSIFEHACPPQQGLLSVKASRAWPVAMRPEPRALGREGCATPPHAHKHQITRRPDVLLSHLWRRSMHRFSWVWHASSRSTGCSCSGSLKTGCALCSAVQPSSTL